jgi:hypothetical protein
VLNRILRREFPASVPAPEFVEGKTSVFHLKLRRERIAKKSPAVKVPSFKSKGFRFQVSGFKSEYSSVFNLKLET